jgi:hypothetical protein
MTQVMTNSDIKILSGAYGQKDCLQDGRTVLRCWEDRERIGMVGIMVLRVERINTQSWLWDLVGYICVAR